ncbi:dihydropteroate synthase [Candidatus Aerophobetes bacterium]|uniref:Dihydropteroate synthase n=1 Tax=Aerophobetes bacterium TaxID=2030807 RepID=A0A497E787_UNCAE|nr:MAG: dihydropteroate synthase [Candidatus Aerophobetes bacterium]
MNPRILTVRDEEEIKEELERIGVSEEGKQILKGKGSFYLIKLEGLSSQAANLLKQEMLAIGGDVAVKKEVVSFTVKRSDVLLMGTEAHYRKVIPRLRRQPFGLAIVSSQIKQTLDNFKKDNFTIPLGGKILNLAKKTAIMGILNVTPDSFYDGGRYTCQDEALRRVEQMIEEGADIIDVGGESTRPGSERVSLKEEIKRVIPIIEKIRENFDVPISIDTYKAEVARQAIEVGANMVNDISGLRFDPKLKKVVAKCDVPVVITHIKGTPKDMQDNPQYRCLMGEIISYLREGIKMAEEAGISSDKIIIDPGIGFGKTTEHNLRIIKRLPELKSLGKPILIGASRKSFIGNVLKLPVSERLEGSLAIGSLSVFQGANIIRTHDVKETRRVVDLIRAVMKS